MVEWGKGKTEFQCSVTLFAICIWSVHGAWWLKSFVGSLQLCMIVFCLFPYNLVVIWGLLYKLDFNILQNLLKIMENYKFLVTEVL